MRMRTVLALEALALMIGGVSLWSLSGTDLGDGAFGLFGAIALVLAISAMFRRSWARVPLLVLAACSGWLALAAFSAHDDPSEIAGFAYLFLSGLIVLTAGLSIVVTISEDELRTSRDR